MTYRRIVALALLASAAASGTWTGPFLKDIPGVGIGQYYFTDGGWSGTLASQCKNKCVATVGCQAAQFCQYGSSCFYTYNGQQKNCFLYNNQLTTNQQLGSAANPANGAFAVWKYTQGASAGGGGGAGSCSGPFAGDIKGVGMAQYKFNDGWAGTLAAQCQAKCQATVGCQAAQFCESGSSCHYPYGGGYYNCFLYNNQNINEPQLIYSGQRFVIYKCGNSLNGAGGGGSTSWKWHGPFRNDIAGIGMAQYHFSKGWWASTTLAQQCKDKCQQTVGCQAVQFCQSGDSCYYPIGGSNKNCFLYNNQNANQPQLIYNGQAFEVYKYGNDGGAAGGGNIPQSNMKWSPAMCVDIPGTGLGGTYENDLFACKQRCKNTWNCVAAQFSQFSTYNNHCTAGWGHSGCNCFLYANSNQYAAVANVIRGFRLYKYNRNGCGSSCCPDNSDRPWNGCQCGSSYGCCPDGFTPKTSTFDSCACQNRRLSVEDDQTPGADGVTITV